MLFASSSKAAVHFTNSKPVMLASTSGQLLFDDLDQITADISLTAQSVQLNGFMLELIGTRQFPNRNWISAPPHHLYVEVPFSEGTMVSGLLDAPSPDYPGISYQITFDQPVSCFGFRAIADNGGQEKVMMDVYSGTSLLGTARLVDVFGGSLYGDFFGFWLSSSIADRVVLRSETRDGGFDIQYGAYLEMDEFVTRSVPEPCTILLCAAATTLALRSTHQRV